MKKYLVIFLLITADVGDAQTQSHTYDYSVIQPSQWIIPHNDTLDYALDNYGGAKALLLKRNILNYKSASVAYPKNLDFKDGTIELDIASPAGKAGYIGLAFRIKDTHHYETLYFRPGSSGTINAVQYMPEKKPEFNWWDYEDTAYQSKATIPATAWFHVKVVVKGRQFTLFMNNQPKAAFVYKNLDPELKNGSVGFWLGNCATGAYKNLMVTSF